MRTYQILKTDSAPWSHVRRQMWFQGFRFSAIILQFPRTQISYINRQLYIISTLDFFLFFYFAFFDRISEPSSPLCWGYWITLTETHTHTRQNSSGWVIGLTQRPLPNSTQHSQETDNHADGGGIQTRNSSRRTATDPRLRPRGHLPLDSANK